MNREGKEMWKREDIVRFNITDFEIEYEDIAERFEIDLSDDETYDRFKRIFKRCYGEEELVVELLESAEEIGKVKELLINASYVVFRSIDEREVLRRYLEYKAPYRLGEEIKEYVDSMREEELEEYIEKLKDFYRIGNYSYIVVYDYLE